MGLNQGPPLKPIIYLTLAIEYKERRLSKINSLASVLVPHEQPPFATIASFEGTVVIRNHFLSNSPAPLGRKKYTSVSELANGFTSFIHKLTILNPTAIVMVTFALPSSSFFPMFIAAVNRSGLLWPWDIFITLDLKTLLQSKDSSLYKCLLSKLERRRNEENILEHCSPCPTKMLEILFDDNVFSKQVSYLNLLLPRSNPTANHLKDIANLILERAQIISKKKGTLHQDSTDLGREEEDKESTPMDRVYVFIHLQTTGPSIKEDEIVQISAVTLKFIKSQAKLTEMERFSSFIKPSIRIQQEASKIHNIYSADLANCLSAKTILESFINFLTTVTKNDQHAILVSFNGNRFDFPLLWRQLQECALKFPEHCRYTLDILEVITKSKCIEIKSKRLSDIYKSISSVEEIENSNSVLNEVDAMIRIFLNKNVYHSHSPYVTPITSLIEKIHYQEETLTKELVRDELRNITLKPLSPKNNSDRERSSSVESQSEPYSSGVEELPPKNAIATRPGMKIKTSQYNKASYSKEAIMMHIASSLAADGKRVSCCNICQLPGCTKQTHPNHDSLWKKLSERPGFGRDLVMAYCEVWQQESGTCSKIEMEQLTKEKVVAIVEQFLGATADNPLTTCSSCQLPGCHQKTHPYHLLLWKQLEMSDKFDPGDIATLKRFWKEAILNKQKLMPGEDESSLNESKSSTDSRISREKISLNKLNHSLIALNGKDDAISTIRNFLEKQFGKEKISTCSICQLPGANTKGHGDHTALWKKLEESQFDSEQLKKCKSFFSTEEEKNNLRES